MTDRPILFSAPMVLALVDGRKTQTRRVLKGDLFEDGWTDDYVFDDGNREWRDNLVRYKVGDRLWIREAWAKKPNGEFGYIAGSTASKEEIKDNGYRLMSSIHLPRKLSRLTLIVTDVRVQRLQDIREADAMDEGAEAILVPPDGGSDPHVVGFCKLWDSIHGEGAWDRNPWVVALTFTVHKANIDSLANAPICEAVE